MISEAFNGALLDSDYIIALTITNESTHRQAKALDQRLVGIRQFILRPVTYELATVLSRKFGHEVAADVLREVRRKIAVLDITALEGAIWQEFHARTGRNISFFDCANLLIAKHLRLKIASFDHFYPASLLVS